MAKRQREEENGEATPMPRKTRKTINDESIPGSPAVTPSGRKSILRGTPTKANGFKDDTPTPTPLKKVLFTTTPQQKNERQGAVDSPTASRNDRSARRKSARTLQLEQTQQESDVEEDETDARIAAEILDSEEEQEDHDSADETTDVASSAAQPDTPSKPGKPRGRPKGRRRERTPTPPPDLPPHELYFFQNRAGANKTSANTLPSHLLLNHEDFRTHITAYKDPHAADIAQLAQLHKRGFGQWAFELSEGFNLCLYGYGSKRSLTMDFASHLHHASPKSPKIIVINGYTPGLTIRDILTTLSSQLLPKTTKLPAQPLALLDLLLATLTASPTTKQIYLIIHSLDHPNLRKHQPLLATLATHPKISLIATLDTPNFALLWDTSLTHSFKFLHHDTTTFVPYSAAELDSVETVNTLLGRSGRRLGGKDGVGYVLKSLPENARNLFRILVAEQLALSDSIGDALPINAADDIDEDDILGASDEEEALAQSTPSRRGRGRPAAKAKVKAAKVTVQAVVEGVEYRTLYHKAVEEFVCSSEVNFRTLLKEFHDHRMIESRKDALGTERLVVPFRREELEGVLEELA